MTLKSSIMKYLSLLSIMLLFIVFMGNVEVLNSQVQVNPSKGYKLVFDDEFNQPDGSAPNPKIWKCRGRSNSIYARWICDIPQVAYIKDGALVCLAIPNTILPNDTAKMLTGAVDTQNRFNIKYGRVDVRLRTNLQEGNFPAAWMRPQPSKDKTYAEFDILEVFGNTSVARQTVHCERSFNLKANTPQREFLTHIDVTQWHVYSIEWDKKKVTFYIDGRRTGTYKKLRDQNKNNYGEWNFDRPFYIILNQSVGQKGWHEPDVNATYETKFDWVRVYQKK